MILTTDRLTLRPQESGDASALSAILSDGEAMRFWSRPAITRLAVVEDLVREQQDAMTSGLCRYWTVEEKGDVIGSVDLSLIENASAELGFLLRRLLLRGLLLGGEVRGVGGRIGVRLVHGDTSRISGERELEPCGPARSLCRRRSGNPCRR